MYKMISSRSRKRQHKKKIPAADFISYVGTVKAGFSASSTLDTVDEITDANIIMAVVKGGEFSARSGLNTVSMAKKHPATAALKPEKAPKAIHYAYRLLYNLLGRYSGFAGL